MIKTLIVDDEALVRKGLAAIAPWDRYGLQVVGEAANGEKALEFMGENEVDLVITDLVMPAMNGLELMRAIRRDRPRVWMVVLTCHQDFQYIQEALRLGAIDYIVKTQLEKETMEEVFARIADRIGRDQADSAARTAPGMEGTAEGVVPDARLRFSDEVVDSVIKAARLIRERLGDELNQDLVAREVSMSRGYFSHCFKEIMGLSFSDYLRHLRMARAKTLLTETSKPVYWIARELGFHDEKYFSKLFREQTGCLPTDFRSKSQ